MEISGDLSQVKVFCTVRQFCEKKHNSIILIIFSWYAWYILCRLTKILFLPSMSKSLQFTSSIHQNIMFVPLAHVGLVVASLPCLGCFCCLCKVVIFVGPCSCFAQQPRLESRLYALIWKYKYLLFYYSFDCFLSH